MVSPLDTENIRETKEKRDFTVSANSRETVFYKDNEDGWVNEIFIYCNGNLTLEVYLGPSKEEMKISDAYTFGLLYPNTSFWVPVYDTSSSLYAIAFQPFNPQPYRGSVTLILNNTTSSDIVVTRAIFRRIIKQISIPAKLPEPGQEFPPYAVIPKKK